MSTGYVWAGYVWAPYVWADGVWAGSQQTSNITDWSPVVPGAATSWGATSQSSTWNKFNTLRPIGSEDVDFIYRASEGDPVIANSIIPVRITERSEQP